MSSRLAAICAIQNPNNLPQENGDVQMFRFAKFALAAAIAMLAALVTQPSLAAVVTNSTTPFSLPFINPCKGHLSIDAGLFHTVASTTFDGAGFQTKLHTNEVQARDTDQVTGVVCVDTGTFNFEGLNFNVFSGTDGRSAARGNRYLYGPRVLPG